MNTDYRIVLKKEAAKYLGSLDRPTKARIRAALEGLTKTPPEGDIVTLQGMTGFFRLRIGDYRAIFRVDEQEKVIYVRVIAPRGDVYKR